jgi:hypothetical protein
VFEVPQSGSCAKNAVTIIGNVRPEAAGLRGGGGSKALGGLRARPDAADSEAPGAVSQIHRSRDRVQLPHPNLADSEALNEVSRIDTGAHWRGAGCRGAPPPGRTWWRSC